MLDIKEINALDKKIINELEQKNMTNQTESMRQNAQGHLVPESLIKPIDLHELAARLRALVRRAHGQSDTCLAAGDVVLPQVHLVAVFLLAAQEGHPGTVRGHLRLEQGRAGQRPWAGDRFQGQAARHGRLGNHGRRGGGGNHHQGSG